MFVTFGCLRVHSEVVGYFRLPSAMFVTFGCLWVHSEVLGYLRCLRLCPLPSTPFGLFIYLVYSRIKDPPLVTPFKTLLSLIFNVTVHHFIIALVQYR